MRPVCTHSYRTLYQRSPTPPSSDHLSFFFFFLILSVRRYEATHVLLRRREMKQKCVTSIRICIRHKQNLCFTFFFFLSPVTFLVSFFFLSLAKRRNNDLLRVTPSSCAVTFWTRKAFNCPLIRQDETIHGRSVRVVCIPQTMTAIICVVSLISHIA